MRRLVLAGATSLFIDSMSTHVIASLDLSPSFGRTMVAGVLLLAAPAIIGFYVSVAGRSLVGGRFDLPDTSGARHTGVSGTISETDRLSLQRSLVDERVAADRALLVALVRGEDDLDLHERQLANPGRRDEVNDFTRRAGDLTRRADHLFAFNALCQRELAGAAELATQPQCHQLIVLPHGTRDDGAR